MAAQHPDKELARVQNICRAGLPPLLVLAGQGTWFREQALAAVLAAIPKDAELLTLDGLDVEVRGLAAEGAEIDEADASFNEDEADQEPLSGCKDLEVLRGGGLFFRNAFVLVRRADRWLRRYTDALAKALPKFSKGSGLVLETQKVDKRKKFWKGLADSDALFEFRDLYDQPFDRSRGPLEGELVQWLVQKSRSFGVSLAPESALLMSEQVGKAPGELVAELHRLRDAVGQDPKRKPLQPQDLRGKLSVGFESTPFELADAVLARDRAGSFRSLRAIFDRSVRQRDGKAMDDGGKFPFATSWLFSSMAQLHEGRLLLDEGVRAEDVPARVGVRGFPDRYLTQLKKSGREQLERGLLSLLQCQRDKRLSGEDDDVLLEQFLLRWFDNALPPVRDLEW
ncbi:MAG: hypothetical protein NT107_04185 [Planctomycetota bacterium]|nr:hypothetical protein [Planctomycetota bacterium]